MKPPPTSFSAAGPRGRAKTGAARRLEQGPSGTPLKKAWPVPVFVALALSLITTTARAGWYDNNWTCRRAITLSPDDDKFPAGALATVELYTDGHALPDFSDLRITTEDGHLVPSHVLQAGPGDRVRAVFQVDKSEHNYFAYFGNPHPAPPPHADEDVIYHNGLLIETKVWTGGAVHTFDQLEKSWARSGPVLGRAIIPAPFLGYNPFGDQEQYISQVTGQLTVPTDGDYDIAMTVDDDAALYIDDKPTLVAHLGPPDARFHTKLHLDHGPHAFRLLHVNAANEGRFTVAWRPAGTGKYEVIPAADFGVHMSATAGAMEIYEKTLTADFTPSLAAECFFADGYSFRYHFTANVRANLAAKIEWDFGDGQTATGADADHVYLAAGVYPVQMTARAGGNSDVQTNRVAVERNYLHILISHEDSPEVQSPAVANDNLEKLSPAELDRAVLLHLEADRLDPAVAAAQRLAIKSVTDPERVVATLTKLEKKLVDAGRPDDAIAVWDRVPVDSRLQPGAAMNGATLALWWVGDVGKAVKLLEPFKDRQDESVRRLYAESLVLAGRVAEGKKILEAMEQNLPANRRAAVSGASARTVEFFITEKDTDSGEAAWDRWAAKFPADFLEGYSVVLRTKLIEQRKRPDAAAKIGEAFAAAVPKSSYAPQLLDRASKLLATIDPAKSAALRQTLKDKYPEDPLSQ
jgi:hypothetical protein